MDFAWNTQKNKLNDVKGKEIEQDRKSDNLKNDDIDKSKTYLNYDLIKSDFNLYQRVKRRIDEVRENSRIQKNSVVMYSNVITVNEETYREWGIDKTKKYFECVTDFFKNEFGEENIVSAKVHLDETTPHMHLHFVPVSHERKLQARKVMTPSRINKIHSEAPKFLREKGFDVERGKGETGKKNIKDIHRYKAKKLEENISELIKQKDIIENQIKDFKKIINIDTFELDSIETKESLFNKKNIVIDKNTLNEFKNAYRGLLELYKVVSSSNFSLKLENKYLKQDIENLNKYKNDTLKSRNFYLNKRDEMIDLEKSLKSQEEINKDLHSDLFYRELELKKKELQLEEDKKSYKNIILKELENEFKDNIEFYKNQIEKLKKQNLELLDKNTQLNEFNLFLNNSIKIYPSLNEKIIKDIDNSYLKFIYSDIPKIQEGDIYVYRDAKELISIFNEMSLIQNKQNYVKFELYKDFDCEHKIGSSNVLLGVNKHIDLIPNLKINYSKNNSKNKNYELEI